MSKGGKAIAGIGVVFIVLGVVLMMIQTSSSIFGITYATSNPYSNVGMMLIIVGVIMAVAGGIISAIPSKPSNQLPQMTIPYYQQPIAPPPYQAPQMYAAPPNTPNAQGFCANCGAPKEAGSFCKRCGAKLD
jgi:vacuolar-type H+-ATPase subunit I/STV1